MAPTNKGTDNCKAMQPHKSQKYTQLEFVTVGHGNKAAAKERARLVRSTAMRYYHQNKRNRHLRPRAEGISRKTPRPILPLISSRGDDSGSSGTPVNTQPNQVQIAQSDKRPGGRQLALIQYPVFDISPSCLDPFDSLSVKSDIRLSKVVRFCMSFGVNLTPHTNVNIWGRFSTKPWGNDISLDENDALNLNTRLFFASSIHDRATGAPSKDTYYFKDQTFRLLREWIEKSDEAPSNTAIFTILILALMAATVEDIPECVSHQRAAKKLIAARGGIKNFPLEFRRLAVWIDLNVASFTLLPIRWPCRVTLAGGRLPADLVEAATQRHERTLLRLSPRYHSYAPLLRDFQIIGLSSTPQWHHYAEHSAVNDLFFKSIYKAFDLAGFDASGCSEKHSDIVIGSQKEPMDIAMALVSRMFLQSSTYMVYSCMVYRETFSKELALVFRNNMDEAALRAREGELDLMLWMLFVIVNCCPYRWRPQFMQHIARILITLKADENFLPNLMKDFPWTDGFGTRVCEQVWLEATSLDLLEGLSF